MKIIVKTLKNKCHEFELKEDETVADLKQLIEKASMAEVEAQRILHKGKILRDNQLASDIGEGSTVILMARRKNKKPKKEVVPSAAPTDENSTQDVNPPPSPRLPGPTAEELAAQDVYKAVVAQRSADEAKVNQLVEKGFDKTHASQALGLAKGDVALAESYLTDGIPAELARSFDLTDEQRAQVDASIAAQKKMEEEAERIKNLDPSTMSADEKVDMLDEMQNNALHVQKIAEEQFAKNNDLQGMPARLAMMMQVPGLMQQLLSNPMVQQQVMGLLSQEKPDLYARFNADPDAVGETDEFQRAVFTVLANATGREMPAPRKPNVIRLTQEQSEQLTALNAEFEMFDRRQLIQAYMHCGSDFERTRAFLTQQLAQHVASQPRTEETKSESKSG